MPANDSLRQLLTYHGTVVFLDVESGRLRHGEAGSSPRNVFLGLREEVGSLVHAKGDGRLREIRVASGLPESPVQLRDAPSDATQAFALASGEGDTVGLLSEGLYLCAEPNGSVTLSRQQFGMWERFSLGEGQEPTSPDAQARRATKRSVILDEFLTALIRDSTFSFARSDGTVLGKRVKLLPDGSISGYSHQNESGWAIGDEGLIFRDQRGKATTIFDKIDYAEDGTLVLVGRFVGAGRNDYIHRLETVSSSTPEFASVVSRSTLSTKPSAPTAVLVRTYKCDAKYKDLMSKLNASRERFDLYAIVDETHGRHDPGEWPTIWHSEQACRRLGLTQKHPDILRVCGDFPLYFALREIPSYQHYIMIEDDVELRDPDASFIVELCKVLSDPEGLMTDFAGVVFSRIPLAWGPATTEIYTEDYCYLVRFPFVVVSKRLCAYLFSQRQVEAARDRRGEDVMHCEAFVPSAAMAGGFTCHNINKLVPGCYDQSIMMLEVPGYARPMGAVFRGPDSIRMYHPVYTEEEWLHRTRWRFSVLGDEALRSLVKGLAQERSLARESGDMVMANAIEKLRNLLDPKWQDLLDLNLAA